MLESPRVALLSRRLVENKVWQASQYEFEDVITDVADVHLVAPQGRRPSATGQLAHRVLDRARAAAGRPREDRMDRWQEAVDADLFFATFSTPFEIGALPHVKEQLERSTVKVAFIVELYAPGVGRAENYLRQLRGFDHIFVFSRAVLPELESLTGVPCSFLPTGVDALRFVPQAPEPPRAIDVLSYGRRYDGIHGALLDAMRSGSLHYHFDTSRMPFEVTGHVDHRTNLAATLQRSRYAVVHKINDDAGRRALTGGEDTLTNRYFEATAAGAVVLGSSPDAADFADAFPWAGAVVPVRTDGTDVLATIAELDADPARATAVRRAGITAALRRHDWAYRWQHVLSTVGLEESPRLATRLRLLAEHAGISEVPDMDPSPAMATTGGTALRDDVPSPRKAGVEVI